MTPQILITAPDQISEAMELVITVASLNEMITDLVAAGMPPGAIVLNPMDARIVIEELNDHGTAPDAAVIGFIQGVPITQHAQVNRGAARIIPKASHG